MGFRASKRTSAEFADHRNRPAWLNRLPYVVLALCAGCVFSNAALAQSEDVDDGEIVVADSREPGNLRLFQQAERKGSGSSRSRRSAESKLANKKRQKAAAARSSARPTSTTRSRRGKSGSGAKGSAGERVETRLNLKAEDLLKPAEERTYAFSIVEGTYADLVENFARMAGLGVLGEAPKGTVTFISAEQMDFKSALNRVRLLLFKYKPIEPYWLVHEGKHLEVVRVTDLLRYLKLKQIFRNLKEFEAAGLEGNDLAMLLFTPETTSVADFEMLRDFMPDYVRIAPLAEKNSLAIFALVKDIRKYLSLIRLFEGAGEDPRVLEKLAVEHLVPSRAVETLRKLMDDLDETKAPRASKTRGRKAEESLALPGQRTILFPDDAQRVIVVRAVPKKIQDIKEMLAFIDVDLGGVSDPVLIAIEHVDVEELLEIIRPLLGSGSAPKTSSKAKRGRTSKGKSVVSTDDLVLVPVARVNTLVVVAPPEEVDRVRQLVTLFDVPVDDEGPQIIEIMNVPADWVANILTQTFRAATKGKDKALSVFSDATTGAVILSGESQLVEEALQFIERLDVSGGQLPTLHKHKLQNAPPTQVQEIIATIDAQTAVSSSSRKKGKRASRQALLGNLHGDDSTMTLYVVCTEEDWEGKYLPWIRSIDEETIPADTQVTIRLKHIDPQEAVTTISILVGPRGRKKGAGPAPRVAAAGDSIVITSATDGEIELIRSIISEIDRDVLRFEHRLFKINYGDPTVIKTVVENAMSKGRSGGGKKARSDRKISVGVAGSTLVVTASPEDLDAVGDLIAQLDTEESTRQDIRVYTLPAGLDVQTVASSLQTLHTTAGRVSKSVGSLLADQPRFVALSATNRILVAGPTERFAEIERSIEMMTEGAEAEGLVIKFIPIEFGDPAAIANLVQPILALKMRTSPDSDPKRRGGVLHGNKISVTPDVTGERIIVAAPAALVAEAEALIRQLDRENVAGERVMRTIRLARTEPDEMVEAIASILTGEKSAPGKKGSRRRRPKIEDGGATGQPLDVNIVAAPGGGAVVLSGVAQDVEQVERWIEHLDNTAESDRILKIYKIANSDLGTLADMIMAICDPGAPKRKLPTGDDVFGGMFDLSGGVRAGKELVLTIDYWNRTLIVSAAPNKMYEVDQVVHLYEPDEGQDPVLPSWTKVPYMIYSLKVVDAFDAVLAMEDILKVLWPYPDTPEVDYISFTNSLVVKCLPEYFAEAEDLIVKYVDIESAGTKANPVTFKRVKGRLASEIATLLGDRLPGIKIQIKRVGKEIPTVERVGPYRAAAVQPCVLPQSLLNSIGAITAAALNQTPDQDTAESEIESEKRALAEQMLQGFSADSEKQPAADRGHIDANDVLKIHYDDRTGVIRIEGPSRLVKAAEEALDDILDEIEEWTGPRPDIRVYKIKYRDVNAMAGILESMFGTTRSRQQPARGGTAQQQQQFKKLQDQLKKLQQAQGGQQPPGADGRPGQPGKQDGAQSTKTGLGQIVVTPDPQNSALIIKASTEDFPIIEELIATVDRPADVRNEFRIFKLKNLAASAVEEHLKTLLGISSRRRTPTAPRTGGNRGKQTQAIQQIEQALMQMDMGAAGQGAINAATQIKITSNDTANTIFVMAPKEALEVIADLIEQIDAEAQEDTPVFSVVLKSADAMQTAKTMEAIYGQSKKGAKGGGPKTVKFVGDAGSNTIFVTAPQDLQEEIVQRITEMDDLSGGLTTPRVIKLSAGSPSDIAKTLTEAFAGKGGKRGGVRIAADDATKQLFVVAPNDVFEQIEMLARTLDQSATPVEVKVYPLEHARATEVHGQLMKMVQQLARQIPKKDMDVFSAAADERSNAVIVIGGPKTFALVEQVLEQIDIPPRDPTQVVTAIYRLVNANAVELARNINNTYKKKDKGVDPPRAEANATSNILIVRGTKAQQEAINNEIISPFEEGSVAPEKVMQNERIVLAHAKPDETATTLMQIFNDRFAAYKRGGLKNIKATELSVAVTPEMASRSILVTASETNMNLIKELVTNIDQPGMGETGRHTKVFTVQYVDPGATANIVRDAFRTRGKVAPQDVVTVAAEWYTQSIIVTANEENLTRIEALIQELDQDTGQAKIRKIHRLENGQAAEIARIINQSLNETKQRRRRDNRLPVSVIPNEAMNALVITGPAKEVEDVIAMAIELDEKPVIESGRVTRVYHVKYADPGSLVRTLNQMFRRQRGSRPEDQVDVGYDWGTSKLVVTATPKNLERVEALLADIDVESTTVRIERVMKLKFAHAEDLARNMQNLFRQVIRGQRGQASMTIAADAQTNSLIVYANEAEFKRISSLVESLDVKPEESRDRLMTNIKLENANPSNVQQAINDLFRPRGRRQNPRDEVRAIPEWSTMSVIVSASPEKMEQIKKLIEDMDRPGAAGGQVHVVELQHADPAAVTRSLIDIFVRGAQQRNVRGQATVQISNPPGTNTILIKANDQLFEEVMEVVKQLDQADGTSDKIEVIALKHTEADVMQEVLEAYLRKPGGRGRAPQLRGDIRITSNPQNNTIVISGGTEEIEQLKGVIATLDVEVEGAGNAPKILQLQYARASQIEPTLTKMFEGFQRRGGRGRGSSMPPVFATDDQSNTLIVRAGATDLTMIENLVEQLDTPETGDQASFTIIPVAEGVNIVDLAELVESTVNEGERIRSGKTRGAKPDQVIITPDTRANVLVVAGSASLFPDVERLVKRLEGMGVAGGTKTRMIKIDHMDPEEIKRVLDQIIEENSNGSGRSSKSRRGSRRRR